tara:strand:- start:252 stop:803 length:552 start_codon:yes stop_codon:yes gene_type:complete
MSAPAPPPEQKKKRATKVVPPAALEVKPVEPESESEVEVEEVKQEEKKTKEKKELTPAKKEALAKMFAGLKAKREASKAAQETDSAETKESKRQQYLRRQNERRIARKNPTLTSYVTMSDLEHFKNELIGIMPKTVYKEVPVDRIVPKAIAVPIETVREKVVQVVQPPKKISGNELLDSIFFR